MMCGLCVYCILFNHPDVGLMLWITRRLRLQQADQAVDVHGFLGELTIKAQAALLLKAPGCPTC